MMRSMMADQPYSPVTRTHGESARRPETTTLSTLSSSNLHQLARPLGRGLRLLEFLLLLLGLLHLEAVLRRRDELLALVLLELLHGVLVDRVDHVQHLEPLLLEPMEERRVL